MVKETPPKIVKATLKRKAPAVSIYSLFYIGTSYISTTHVNNISFLNFGMRTLLVLRDTRSKKKNCQNPIKRDYVLNTIQK